MRPKEKVVFESIMKLQRKDIVPRDATASIRLAVSLSQFLFTIDKKLFGKCMRTIRKLDKVMNSVKLPECVQILILFGLVREVIDNTKRKRRKIK
jgi:hypothetical protein